jgi:hypothetical protein
LAALSASRPDADNASASRFGVHAINQAPLEASVNWLFHYAQQKNFAFDF